jgi:hypothetical protein
MIRLSSRWITRRYWARGGTSEQRLNGAAERHRVEVVAQVVHPLDDRDHLPVRLVLGRLLDPGVDVADDRLDVAHDLTLECGQQSQHTVGGRMVRTDVERQQLVGLTLAGGLGGEGDRLLTAPVVAAHCHLP